IVDGVFNECINIKRVYSFKLNGLVGYFTLRDVIVEIREHSWFQTYTKQVCMFLNETVFKRPHCTNRISSSELHRNRAIVCQTSIAQIYDLACASIRKIPLPLFVQVVSFQLPKSI